MLRIAIVDDNDLFCSELEKKIEKALNKNFQQGEIDIFNSGELFIEYFQKENMYLDLLFLDIELFEINGVEVGKILREKFHNFIVQIVYISSKESYAMELFQNQPLEFLVKPISQSKIDNCISKFISISEIKIQYFEYIYERSVNRIAVKEILYFESQRRKMIIYTQDEIIPTYSKISDILENPISKYFLQIHRSYIVNKMHIQSFRPNEIILNNNIKLPIGDSFRKTITSYMFSLSDN